jgi:hypothetical protein
MSKSLPHILEAHGGIHRTPLIGDHQGARGDVEGFEVEVFHHAHNRSLTGVASTMPVVDPPADDLFG